MFQADKPAVFPEDDLSPPTPIFVVGASRSGTTMMARILGRQPEVFSFNELHFFEQIWPGPDAVLSTPQQRWMLARLISVHRQGYFSQLTPHVFLDEANLILENADNHDLLPGYFAFLLREAKAQGRRLPLEQTPRNVFFLREILSAEPGSRIIVMIRDPRDVLLSQKNKWKRRFLGATDVPLNEVIRSWLNYHPLVMARLWLAVLSAIQPYNNDPRFIFIRFEDLAADPEQVTRKICAFLGLAYREEMIRVPKVGSSLKSDSTVKHGVDPSVVGGWRRGGLSVAEIAACEKVTGKHLRQWGYTASVTSAFLLGSAVLYFTLPLKLALALLFNLHRFRSLREAVRRRFRPT